MDPDFFWGGGGGEGRICLPGGIKGLFLVNILCEFNLNFPSR